MFEVTLVERQCLPYDSRKVFKGIFMINSTDLQDNYLILKIQSMSIEG